MEPLKCWTKPLVFWRFALGAAVLERQFLDPVHHLGRRCLGKALVNWRQVLEPLEALRLKPPLPLVEAGTVDIPLSTGFGHVPQFLGQFQPGRAQLGRLVRPEGAGRARFDAHGAGP